MAAVHTSASAIYLMQILVAAFLAILFLQSGIDKIVDRRGNLEWLKGHFAKSPLAGTVPALLTAITILEVAAGALSALAACLCFFCEIRQSHSAARSFPQLRSLRCFLGSDSRKIMQAPRCSFRIFCLRWPQFICSRQG